MWDRKEKGEILVAQFMWELRMVPSLKEIPEVIKYVGCGRTEISGHTIITSEVGSWLNKYYVNPMGTHYGKIKQVHDHGKLNAAILCSSQRPWQWSYFQDLRAAADWRRLWKWMKTEITGIGP